MFEITLPRETIWGGSKIKEVSGKIRGKRVFLVTATNVYNSLEEKITGVFKDCHFAMYSEIDSEPTIEIVDRGALLCRDKKAEVVVGIGGGSVLDAGKAIALLQKNSGSIRDYQMGDRSIENRGIPYIAVPTTAGTGSEGTKTVVITNQEEKIKKSINHPYAVPDVAVLDPDLTLTLPEHVTALTGIDALSHAVESYVSLNANPLTESVALKAIELIGNNLKDAVKDGSNMEARGNMLLASYLAGISLNAGVGIAHMLAQPIGAACGLSHSEAIGVVLPRVVEANAGYAGEKYLKIAKAFGKAVQEAEEAAEVMQEFSQEIGIKTKFSDFGIGEEKIHDILVSVSKSTVHINTNPFPVDESVLREVLRKSLGKRKNEN